MFDLDGNGSARAFSLGGADLAITLAGEHGARVLATAGGRDFVYKPEHDFDWRGFAAGASRATRR